MRRTTVIAGLVLAVGTLAACTQSAASKSGGGNLNAAAGGVRAAAPSATPSPPANGGSYQLVGKLPLDDGSAKIRVAEMTVEVRRGPVAAAADRAGGIAIGVGGEVDADQRTSGKNATASLQLRVPPVALTSVLRQLGALGHEVSRQVSTTDVTEKVADVDSRVASARGSIARLRALYAQARKVGDVIAVESELGTREADLESLEAQQRTLSRQTSMATISLSLQTAQPVVAAKRAEHRGGFLGGLERGWHGFAEAASWAAAAAGTVLPFLALLALVGLGARMVWRRPRPSSS
jgi:acetolactate synthase regulatory subunit